MLNTHQLKIMENKLVMKLKQISLKHLQSTEKHKNESKLYITYTYVVQMKEYVCKGIRFRN
jgi:hypothetical protein